LIVVATEKLKKIMYYSLVKYVFFVIMYNIKQNLIIILHLYAVTIISTTSHG